MEQSLIEKYLAGETTAQENQLLRQQLQAKSADICTNEEKALLIMLTGSHQEEDNSEDIFAVDYSCEYDKIVHHNKVRKMAKRVSVITAIAACIAFVWLIGWPGSKDSERTDMASKEKENLTLPRSQGEGTEKDSIHYSPLEGEEREGSTIPITKEDPSESNHYAWAKSLMDSYHEDDLDDLEGNPDNSFRQDREWAQTER